MDKHLDMRMIEDYPRPGGSCRMREKMIGSCWPLAGSPPLLADLSDGSTLWNESLKPVRRTTGVYYRRDWQTPREHSQTSYWQQLAPLLCCCSRETGRPLGWISDSHLVSQCCLTFN
ncbi:hypothetical protein Pcinc_002603 [Petrolisthes cinctipes]|uniref:Uncharacterized protein n=1 Tax=Petrolisthes cinctipes TaxID=88211 RepID=A0AAE1GPX5_PETCI|nr:hypothetical protein Pcinc_002603 [Petrolisthes cinctipes]